MRLAINRCPIHGYRAITIDGEDGSGQRVTPSKCCGQWRVETSWELSSSEWRELARAAEEAAEESER